MVCIAVIVLQFFFLLLVSNVLYISFEYLKGTTSRFAHLEKFASLNFSSLLFTSTPC